MGFSLNPLNDISSALHDGEKITEDGARDFASAMKDAAKVVSHMSPSQMGHTALDIVGMVPVVGTVANLANAGWYAAQGDWQDAAWSAAAAIPIEGDVADAAKLGKDAVDIAEDGATAERAIKDGEDAAKVAKDGEAADQGAASVWVQHGKGGTIREYAPDQVQGEPKIGTQVRTDVGTDTPGRGEVVARGEPPNKSDVELADPTGGQPSAPAKQRIPTPETDRGRIAGRLQRDGWEVRHGGNHDIYTHPSKPGRITLPRHGTVSIGVARQIARTAGWIPRAGN